MLARAAGGDGHSRVELLLFSILDTLRQLAWLQSKDGAKGINRPTPTSPVARPTGVRTGGTHLDQDQVMAMLAAVAPPRPEGGPDVDN